MVHRLKTFTVVNKRYFSSYFCQHLSLELWWNYLHGKQLHQIFINTQLTHAQTEESVALTISWETGMLAVGVGAH